MNKVRTFFVHFTLIFQNGVQNRAKGHFVQVEQNRAKIVQCIYY